MRIPVDKTCSTKGRQRDLWLPPKGTIFKAISCNGPGSLHEVPPSGTSQHAPGQNERQTEWDTVFIHVRAISNILLCLLTNPGTAHLLQQQGVEVSFQFSFIFHVQKFQWEQQVTKSMCKVFWETATKAIFLLHRMKKHWHSLVWSTFNSQFSDFSTVSTVIKRIMLDSDIRCLCIQGQASKWRLYLITFSFIILDRWTSEVPITIFSFPPVACVIEGTMECCRCFCSNDSCVGQIKCIHHLKMIKSDVYIISDTFMCSQ